MTVALSSDSLRLDLGTRSYDIHVGPGLVRQAGALIRPMLAQPRVFVVADQNVADLHYESLARSLGGAGIAHELFVIAPGEASKSFSQLENLLESLLAAGVERGTTVLAFGGGVVGDLAGFAASVLLRGVPYVQIPTTLLSQVDSSVGGKTGINTRYGKNLVGTFYQPRVVLADTELLATLPVRELRSGYAEVVKYGLIDEPSFFDWLDTNAGRLFAGDEEARRHAVRISCQAKARIVGADERESGARALLNLGHTFAHALEADTGYGACLTHGEAVSIGLVMAFDLSVRLGFCPSADATRVRTHLARLEMPVKLPAHPEGVWQTDRLLAHFTRDKKVKDGRIGFILVRGIGLAFQYAEVPAGTLRAVLDDAVREGSS